jgi:hypothetical protein
MAQDFLKKKKTNQHEQLIIMKRTIGIILSIVGLIGTIITGINAADESDSFSFLGLDIAVSSANWTPLIISVAILIIGLVITFSGRKS